MLKHFTYFLDSIVIFISSMLVTVVLLMGVLIAIRPQLFDDSCIGYTYTGITTLAAINGCLSVRLRRKQF